MLAVGTILHLVGEGIDGVLAGIEGIDPDALLPAAHQVAVLEGVAGDVLALIADIGDDHADVGDGDLGHGLVSTVAKRGLMK
jgi:hypothetical protein